MRVALVCDWFPPRMGGLEIHLADLARELGARGHLAEVICTIPGPERWQGVRVHRLPVPMTPGLETIRGPGCMPLLERLFRERAYDVIHLHTVISPLAHAGAAVARHLGLPSVLTEHSVLRPFGVAGFRIGQALVYRWADHIDVLSAVSGYVAEDLRRCSGRDDVIVLHPGISPDDWRPRERVPDEPLVASAIRFRRRKRPDLMVRAIPGVLARLPAGAPRPRFTLLGEGPERPAVARLAERLGVSEHLELPGFQPREVVRETLARTSVFLLTSEKEACPVATLQARCAGVPVVSLDNGGIHDTLRHGEQGFVARDLDDFCACVARLLQDRELQERMSAATRKDVHRFFWDTVITEHLAAYDLAVRRAGRAAPPLAAA